MAELPTLFLSHGAPNLCLYANPAREFLTALGKEIGKPQAIILMSSHFESPVPSFIADEKPGMIYDFKGFETELYQKVYAAPGLPELATVAATLVEQAGFPVQEVIGRGFDHGAWNPLSLMYPDADIPVVEMSVQPEEGAGHHFVVGRALAPLRKHGVLVIGSGNLTHNFDEMYDSHQDFISPAAAFVLEFADWVKEKAEAGSVDEINDYRALAPHAAKHHPKADHYFPLPFALGAAGEGAKGKRIHTSVQRGGLVMDAYLFQ
jgi:4,5-DOPA dioxygenase extradiol